MSLPFEAHVEANGHLFVYRSDEAGFEELVDLINAHADDIEHPLTLIDAANLSMQLGRQQIEGKP